MDVKTTLCAYTGFLNIRWPVDSSRGLLTYSTSIFEETVVEKSATQLRGWDPGKDLSI